MLIGAGFRFGFHVERGGVEPTRSAGDLVLRQAICRLNDPPDGGLPPDHAFLSKADAPAYRPPSTPRRGVIWLDGRHVETQRLSVEPTLLPCCGLLARTGATVLLAACTCAFADAARVAEAGGCA